MQRSVKAGPAEAVPDREDRSAAPAASLVFALLVLIAVQRGGYYPEAWGLPTAAAGWILAIVALVGSRQRLRRIELVQLAGFGLLALWALVSSGWAAGGLGSVLPQVQLLALYGATVGATLILFSRAVPVITATWASVVAVSLLGLATRLFPGGSVNDPTALNRLSEPLGYWNSLGLWATIGIALGIVLAARSRSLVLRSAAAAGCVPCAVTVYFTFSRGAWISLAIGIVAALMIDHRRLGLTCWCLIVLPWSAAGVLVASRSQALTSASPMLSRAQRDGRSLAVELIILSICAAAAAALGATVERRWSAPPQLRRIFAGTLATLCILLVMASAVSFGTPLAIAIRAGHRFAAPPPATGDNLNAHLFEASGSFRIDLWRVAWRDAERHPLVGSGAGSYTAQWYRHRPVPIDATNAHELYLETLAELGPLGLLLLIVALGSPLVAAWRARRHPLLPGVLAAYVAFLAHVAADWDWQVAAVGLVALTCGSTLEIMARGSRSTAPGPGARAALAFAGIALAVFALWSLHGTRPLGQARDAVDQGNWAQGVRSADVAAARVGGFSALPWQLLGEAQTALRESTAARVSLRVAVKRDPSSWEAWYDLAQVTNGAERRYAVGRALLLNPRGSETQSLANVVGGASP